MLLGLCVAAERARYVYESKPNAIPTYANGEVARLVLTNERVQVLDALNCRHGASKCDNYTVRATDGKLHTYYEEELTKDTK